MTATTPRQLVGRAKAMIERRLYGETFWDVRGKVEAAFHHLALFAPNSRGTPDQLHALMLLAARDTVPLLATLVEAAGGRRATFVTAEAFAETEAERAAAQRLKLLLDAQGSDKATLHNYHHVYGAILTRLGEVGATLEIGMGTNHEDAVSHMGSAGRPGASLRAFAEFLPAARIYGADVDRRILFQEGRISTFFVDQTDPASFADLEAQEMFDVIIDDGLHAPNANLAVLLFAMRRLKPGGWLAIEDVPARALPLWQVVAALLPPSWHCVIVEATESLVFTARRSA
jgi:SAM-dependent methyltransferase